MSGGRISSGVRCRVAAACARGRAAWGATGLFTLGLALAPPPAMAAPPATDRFDNSKQVMIAGFNDVSFDTGWIPAGSPVQLRLDVAAANTLGVSMFGEALYDWDSEAIYFEGDADGGLFTYDVGVEMVASVKVDVIGLNWTSDFLGPYDLFIDDDATFTPYLLEGSPDRPVIVADATDGVTVASVPIVPDILIASGNLDIDVAFDVSASLEGKSIRVTGPLNEASAIEMGERVPILPDDAGSPEDPLEVEAQLFARVSTDTTVIIRPHLVMTVFGTDYDIAGIDIPVDLPEYDDDFVFEPVPLSFDRPDPGAESGEGSGSDGGSGEAGETGASGESGDDAGFGEGLDDGCACSSERGASPMGGLAAFVLLLGLRRRRRSIEAS